MPVIGYRPYGVILLIIEFTKPVKVNQLVGNVTGIMKR